jgi:hypothetical protein
MLSGESAIFCLFADAEPVGDVHKSDGFVGAVLRDSIPLERICKSSG